MTEDVLEQSASGISWMMVCCYSSAEFLKNVSQGCKISGISLQHFYDIKKAFDEHGIEA